MTCRKSKGFTLIEMLVVVAVIAILVAIIIPTVSGATKKAKAAVDAANLRSVLGEVDAVLIGTDDSDAAFSSVNTDIPSSSFHGATVAILYSTPAFVDVYYVDGANYYGLEYFSAIAEGRDGTVLTQAQALEKNGGSGTWYPIV